MATEKFWLLSNIHFEVFTFLVEQFTETNMNPPTSTFCFNLSFQAKNRIILKMVSTYTVLTLLVLGRFLTCTLILEGSPLFFEQ